MTLARASLLAAAALPLVPCAAHASAWDLGASVAYEARGFVEEPQFEGQFEGVQSSLAIEGDIRWENEARTWDAVFIPFVRLDGQDDERTHADIREGFVRWTGDATTVRVGLGKVFWGVTESRQLVDIINQTDAVEDIDEEDKLGQPMIEVSRQQDWGRTTFWVLPGFRERTFSGEGGRLRGPLPVDEDEVIYEDAAEERRVDVAARYSHFIGDWDVGVGVFHGTSREPRLLIAEDGESLIPAYDVITQASADVQYTRDAWLWKFEGIVREGQGDTFGAVNAGVEYTFFGITQSGSDLGVLFEVHWDGRETDPAVAPQTPFDEDVFVAARWAANDIQDTSILAGAIIDAEDGSTSGLVEAERRFGDNWVGEVEMRFLVNVDDQDPLQIFEDDTFVTARLTRFF